LLENPVLSLTSAGDTTAQVFARNIVGSYLKLALLSAGVCTTCLSFDHSKLQISFSHTQ